MLSAVCDAQPAEGIFNYSLRSIVVPVFRQKELHKKGGIQRNGKLVINFPQIPLSTPVVRPVLYISDRKIPIFDWLYHLLYAMIVL